MAEVTSFTAERILQLIETVEAQARQIESLSVTLTETRAQVDAALGEVNDFNNNVAPGLIGQVNEASAQVGVVNDGLPAMQQSISDNSAAINNVNVSVDSLQGDILSMGGTVGQMKQTFRQPAMPEDIEANNLQLGDEWYDDDDLDALGTAKKYIWNGTQWVTESFGVEDFSLTAQKFKTSRHEIY